MTPYNRQQQKTPFPVLTQSYLALHSSTADIMLSKLLRAENTDVKPEVTTRFLYGDILKIVLPVFPVTSRSAARHLSHHPLCVCVCNQTVLHFLFYVQRLRVKAPERQYEATIGYQCFLKALTSNYWSSEPSCSTTPSHHLSIWVQHPFFRNIKHLDVFCFFFKKALIVSKIQKQKQSSSLFAV